MNIRVPFLVVTGAVLVIGIFLWWYFSSSAWPIKNYPSTSSGPVLMFGDSLVEGVGANVGQGLPEQLGRLAGVSVLNYGVSGDTTRNGLKRLTPALAEHPKVALILLGGNDFLKKIPHEETFANLKKIVTDFQSEGAIVIVLGVRSGLLGGGADAEYETLAKQMGAVYLSDVLSGVFGHPDLMSDALHPNSVGYGIIAARIAPLLKKYDQ